MVLAFDLGNLEGFSSFLETKGLLIFFMKHIKAKIKSAKKVQKTQVKK